MNTLRFIRQVAGLTQIEMGERLGLSGATISQIELSDRPIEERLNVISYLKLQSLENSLIQKGVLTYPRTIRFGKTNKSGLYALREKAHLSQSDLACKLGMPLERIMLLEQQANDLIWSKLSLVQAETLCKLCDLSDFNELKMYFL